jgi:putative phosphoesterase
MTRIGVVSDTHNRKISDQLWKDFQNVDMIIHAGDICAMSDLEKFRRMKATTAVAGNMDESDVRATLPEKQLIHVEEVVIGVYHGFGPPRKVVDSAQEVFKNDKVDVVVFGHSHIPYMQKIDGVLYFNPGSPTDHVCAPYLSYGIIEVDKKNVTGQIVKIKE